ncbi:unnamed protein product [Rotaria sp. Silwood1]|nr:unnamed protein product [Rotaria sp. Silwood1]
MMGCSKRKYHHDHSQDRKRFRHQSSSTSSSCMSTRNFTSIDEEEQYHEKKLTHKNRTIEKIDEEHQTIKAKKKQQHESRKFQRYSVKSNETERKEKTAFISKGECMSHRNINNLYDDEKLLTTFVWKKKLEKDGLSNISPEYLRTIMAQCVKKNKTEMKKLKQQRLEREFQNEIKEKEKEFLQCIKEVEYFRKWKKQEELFHFNQIHLRSKLRIAHGRAKPIDLFIHYITNDDDNDLVVGIREPSTYLNGLTIHDLEDLLADIRVYTKIVEQQQKVETKLHIYDVQYWQDITTITRDELSNLRKLSANLNNDQNIHIKHSVIFQDVTETFRNKTLQELEQLERYIRSKIENEKDIDIGYWELALSQLEVHIARTRLRDRHQLKLARKFQKIKEEQSISTTSKMNDNHFQSNEDLENKCLSEYEQGCYSPKLVNIHDFDIDIFKCCILEADDWKKLKQQRQSIIKSDSVKSNVHDIFDELTRKIGSLTDDDLIVNEVISTDIQPLWSDKYKPRKPRFFNKVHTGYVWNSYNKKHYDIDNPPPKIIQGYKFNIFYPDLIDKNQQPSYSLTICENNRNFSILKFHAGPPYENIAFKIVNEEWDKSCKHGFQCLFQNGILRLWFKFRKYKYRR